MVVGIQAAVGAVGQLDAALLVLPVVAGAVAAELLEYERAIGVAAKVHVRLYGRLTRHLRHEEEHCIDQSCQQEEHSCQPTQRTSESIGIAGSQAIRPRTGYHWTQYRNKCCCNCDCAVLREVQTQKQRLRRMQNVQCCETCKSESRILKEIANFLYSILTPLTAYDEKNDELQRYQRFVDARTASALEAHCKSKIYLLLSFSICLQWEKTNKKLNTGRKVIVNISSGMSPALSRQQTEQLSLRLNRVSMLPNATAAL